MYIERKKYLLDKLQRELNVIKYKMKFIDEFVNNTIEIRNKSKKEIIKSLLEKGYPKLIINSEIDVNYNYILKMNLFKLTKEEIELLKSQFEIKNAEVEKLINISENKIWNNELDKLAKIYKKSLIKS